MDGVVLPNGDGGAEVPVSTTGLKVRAVPKTGGEAWDAIRNGPINPQGTTKIGDVDFAASGHTLLGLHANAAITFDLAPMRAALKAGALRFRASVGYGGRPESETNADARVFVDGEPVFVAERIGPKSGPLTVNLLLPETARYLTLMSTDGRGREHRFRPDFLRRPAHLTGCASRAHGGGQSRRGADADAARGVGGAAQVAAEAGEGIWHHDRAAARRARAASRKSRGRRARKSRPARSRAWPV